jgi:hypothetical protein
MEKLSKKITRPFGAGVHLTGDQEMGMKVEGYEGRWTQKGRGIFAHFEIYFSFIKLNVPVK